MSCKVMQQPRVAQCSSIQPAAATNDGKEKNNRRVFLHPLAEAAAGAAKRQQTATRRKMGLAAVII